MTTIPWLRPYHVPTSRWGVGTVLRRVGYRCLMAKAVNTPNLVAFVEPSGKSPYLLTNLNLTPTGWTMNRPCSSPQSAGRCLYSFLTQGKAMPPKIIFVLSKADRELLRRLLRIMVIWQLLSFPDHMLSLMRILQLSSK